MPVSFWRFEEELKNLFNKKEKDRLMERPTETNYLFFVEEPKVFKSPKSPPSLFYGLVKDLRNYTIYFSYYRGNVITVMSDQMLQKVSDALPLRIISEVELDFRHAYLWRSPEFPVKNVPQDIIKRLKKRKNFIATTIGVEFALNEYPYPNNREAIIRETKDSVKILLRLSQQYVECNDILNLDYILTVSRKPYYLVEFKVDSIAVVVSDTIKIMTDGEFEIERGTEQVLFVALKNRKPIVWRERVVSVNCVHKRLPIKKQEDCNWKHIDIEKERVYLNL